MTHPAPGRSVRIADGLRRVLAPNAGPMTYWGTNSFILGEGRVAVVDPGPASEPHLEALLAATRGETVTHILVTHAHADHSPLARELARRTGAPVMGFGPPEAGRSAVMAGLAAAGLAGGGEGVDAGFRPNVALADGDVVTGEGWSVEVVHTPGHFAGHLAFDFGSGLLTGDHVMDWSSTLVSPPDGEVGAFLASSRRLLALAEKPFHPAHGGALAEPAERLDWLIRHRADREAAILNALGQSPQDTSRIARTVYTDLPAAMLPAAERNVFAHLVDLHERSIVDALPCLSPSAYFRLR